MKSPKWVPRPTTAVGSASCGRPGASSGSAVLCPTGNRSPNSHDKKATDKKKHHFFNIITIKTRRRGREGENYVSVCSGEKGEREGASV